VIEESYRKVREKATVMGSVGTVRDFMVDVIFGVLKSGKKYDPNFKPIPA
jgi:hypothetical protein